MGKLRIEKMVLGMVQTNVYLAVNTETMEAVIIDPADMAGRIEAEMSRLGVTPVGILLTHGHFDHIGAVEALKSSYGIKCYAGADEEEVLMNPNWNLSSSYGQGYTVEVDEYLSDGQKLMLAGFEIEVIYTPGHTQGGVCYYLAEEHAVFAGDTLFKTSIGRTDLPTGSSSKLVRSVRELLEKLPDDTIVYPGHDTETKVSFEKKYNPFI